MAKERGEKGELACIFTLCGKMVYIADLCMAAPVWLCLPFESLETFTSILSCLVRVLRLQVGGGGLFQLWRLIVITLKRSDGSHLRLTGLRAILHCPAALHCSLVLAATLGWCHDLIGHKILLL